MEKRACFGTKPKSYNKLQNYQKRRSIMKQMLTVEDVMNICQVKESKAYKLMKQINSEMEKEGYIVIRGRVNSKYLMKKLGIVSEEPVS